MNTLGVIARWVHLAACVGVVGTSTLLLLAGRSEHAAVRAWSDRMTRWSRTLVLLALIGGIGVLAHQTAALEGRPGAILDATAVSRVLLETQAGMVWLVRHGLLLVLSAFLVARLDLTRSGDWLVARGQALLLALAALGLLAASGHAAAVDAGGLRLIGVDLAHLLATGAWVGALPALAALLHTAARDDGAEVRSYAARATRRFARAALAGVAVLLVSGVINTIVHVGSVAGLVGTRYGGLLLLKVALLLPILALAAVNRRRLIPALAGDAEIVGRPAMRRLQRFVVAEGALALTVLLVVAVMGLTPPARHEQPTWPFPFRLSWAGFAGFAGGGTQVLIGSQVAIAGLVGGIASLLVRARRMPLVATAIMFSGAGLAIALPPIIVDAYPTTYVRTPVAYTASSIRSGAALYGEHCAGCHGPHGAGDGPLASGLPRPLADLRGTHTRSHTAGDLFWWLTHGIPKSAMPGFEQRLTDEERWNVVNFVRTLGAAESARQLGPVVGSEQPWLVAPDFTFAVGPTPPRSLRDHRGRQMVLLVLYSLPEARARLAELALGFDSLDLAGVEIIAVPMDGDADAIRRLGTEPRVLFSVVTEGATDIVRTYRLLAGESTHAEFLIDRQGYIRARWTTQAGTTRPIELLLAEVHKMKQEQLSALPADEHVH